MRCCSNSTRESPHVVRKSSNPQDFENWLGSSISVRNVIVSSDSLYFFLTVFRSFVKVLLHLDHILLMLMILSPCLVRQKRFLILQSTPFIFDRLIKGILVLKIAKFDQTSN